AVLCSTVAVNNLITIWHRSIGSSPYSSSSLRLRLEIGIDVRSTATLCAPKSGVVDNGVGVYSPLFSAQNATEMTEIIHSPKTLYGVQVMINASKMADKVLAALLSHLFCGGMLAEWARSTACPLECNAVEGSLESLPASFGARPPTPLGRLRVKQ
ncbi:hypothetical protein TYRP_015770, partial [Tyrophagus putrescentiae]